jgi:hypothetical protein
VFRSTQRIPNSYRQGTLYALFLTKMKMGGLTVNWSALAPVNEQMRSSDDPWLVWVRQQAKLSQKEVRSCRLDLPATELIR